MAASWHHHDTTTSVIVTPYTAGGVVGRVRARSRTAPVRSARGRRIPGSDRPSTHRHPVRGPPPAHPHRGDTEAGPDRNRPGQPLRRAAALRPVRTFPPGDDEVGPLPLHRLRVAVVPPR